MGGVGGGGGGGGGITSSLPNVTVHRLVVSRSHTKWLPFLSLAELGYSVKLQDTLLLHGLSTGHLMVKSWISNNAFNSVRGDKMLAAEIIYRSLLAVAVRYFVPAV